MINQPVKMSKQGFFNHMINKKSHWNGITRGTPVRMWAGENFFVFSFDTEKMAREVLLELQGMNKYYDYRFSLKGTSIAVLNVNGEGVELK